MEARQGWSSATSGLGSGSTEQSTLNSTKSTSNNPQEWCVHAQLTIRHPAAGRMTLRPSTATLTSTDMSSDRNAGTREGNLHFECSWENSGESIVTEVVPLESGIQKFESWTKPGSVITNPSKSDNVQSSRTAGVRFPPDEKLSNYDHPDVKRENVAPPQFNPSLKSRVIQPYGRRCKSTCSITLTNNNTNSATVFFQNRCGSEETERASSLPPVQPIVKDAETQTINSDKSPTRSYKPGPKLGHNKFTSTTTKGEAIGQGTANIVPAGSKGLTCRNVGVGTVGRNRFKQDVIVSAEAESKDFRKVKNSTPAETVERSSRSAVRSMSPKLRAKSSPPVRRQQQHQQSRSNQPRTIHIDVYCTGSDASTNTEDNNSSSEGSTSTPQTVYESPQYKISHRSKKKQMPLCFTSNVAELVNLATNQVKLNRKEKGRPSSFGKISGKLSSMQTSSSTTESNLASDTRRKVPYLDSTIKKDCLPTDNNFSLRNYMSGASCKTTDSVSTSYPSSLGISRNNTATSFSSDWTQVSLNDIEAKENGEDECSASWKNSRDFVFSSRSQSVDSTSIAKSTSYAYSDSLEGLEPSHIRGNEKLKQFSDPEHSEQWWIDYILKKFNLKDGTPSSQENRNTHTPSLRLSRTPEVESSNLLKMKRLSIPNSNLLDGISMDEFLPPFLPFTPKDGDQSETLLETASKFGSVVKGFKKPGHHITGPAKNPDCPCQHCRFYFEHKDDDLRKAADGAFTTNRARAFSLSHVDSLSSSSRAQSYNSDDDNRDGRETKNLPSSPSWNNLNFRWN